MNTKRNLKVFTQHEDEYPMSNLDKNQFVPGQNYQATPGHKFKHYKRHKYHEIYQYKSNDSRHG